MMKSDGRFSMVTFAAALVLAFPAQLSWAQAYPAKAIRFIVLAPPGGPNDFLARMLAESMTKSLGQPVIVDNRPGSSGIVGTEFVARQPADGHTLLNIAAAHVLNPSLRDKLPYDSIRDFAPITQLVSSTFILVTTPSLGVKSVQELIAVAKANPGKLSYASVGVGSAHHLAAELFKSLTGTQMLHVPYKGAAPIIQAMMGREVDLTFISLFPVLKLIGSGKLVGLGVTTASRSALLPKLPTLAEAGPLPGFEVDIWQGVVAPARTPRPIIDRLQTEMAAVLKVPQNAAKLVELGMEPVANSPDRFQEVIKADMDKWAKVIRDANIKTE